MKKKYERITQLTEIVKQKNNISVKELASMLDVSEMTVRRDIEILKNQGVITTLYGSVIYQGTSTASQVSTDHYQLEDAMIAHHTEKQKIGQFAASLIKNDDILIIDIGSTTEELALHVPSDIQVTALCYGHNIMNALLPKSNIDLIFAGGYYHPDTKMFESKEGVALIKSIRAHKVFISAAGIHQTLGVTCANGYEIAAKRAVFDSAVEKILLADSSKFSAVKSAYFADLTDFDTVITDSALDQDWQDYIRELGIQLHIV